MTAQVPRRSRPSVPNLVLPQAVSPNGRAACRSEMHAVTSARSDAPIEQLKSAAYVIPTQHPESDGTLCWDYTIGALPGERVSALEVCPAAHKATR